MVGHVASRGKALLVPRLLSSESVYLCVGVGRVQKVQYVQTRERGAKRQAKGVSVQKVCSSRLWPSRVESASLRSVDGEECEYLVSRDGG